MYSHFFSKDRNKNDIKEYKNYLNNYFKELSISKNNFFTDISNYVSYETGQPTHCYDSNRINGPLSLDKVSGSYDFHTLLGKQINLKNENLVFINENKVINLAGVMGGMNSACDNCTRSVIVECAYFKPEEIIGKSIKYDLHSEASYKFERGVDPLCQNNTLRRFIKIVEDHATITNLQLFSKIYKEHTQKSIQFNPLLIEKILGIKLSQQKCANILMKLGFKIKNKKIYVPSHRSDINNTNDLAEEVARVIGYDNIPVNTFTIENNNIEEEDNREVLIKNFLIDNGFYEVINNPFEGIKKDISICVDNPLDTNRQFMRTNLKNSLVNNILYNERRQKNSIKLFEISDIYTSKTPMKNKRTLGIIASGRIGNNYRNFSKKIDDKYLLKLLDEFFSNAKKSIQNISRDKLDTKLKNEIFYFEVDMDTINCSIEEYNPKTQPPLDYVKYKKISDFPCASRDLSFSIKDLSQSKKLEKFLLDYTNEILKEVFAFDYYQNKQTKEIKVGYRFTFQSSKKTITDEEIEEILNDIISTALQFNSISIPGLKYG